MKLRSVTIILAVPLALLTTSCGSKPSGTAWGVGAFKTNGEQIYFTSTSKRGTSISFTGGPHSGMMMMQGRLACVSCHGTDGQGGVHRMHMEIMNAPDIRWSALVKDHESESHDEASSDEEHHAGDHVYDFNDFKMAVVQGIHHEGKRLNSDMPRWQMSDDDLNDLIAYLKSLP